MAGVFLTVNEVKKSLAENQRQNFVEKSFEPFQTRNDSHIVSCYGGNTDIVPLLVK